VTSTTAERHAHYQRAQVDAIAVGSGTLIVDDPLLTARLVYRERPLTRVVFDRRLRTTPDARLFGTLSAGPVIIVTSTSAVREQHRRARSLEAAGALLLALDSRDLREAIHALGQHDIQSLLLEGGAVLHAAACDAGIVDYVQLYVAPMTFGGDGPTLGERRSISPASLFEQKVRVLGPDVLIEGYVHRPD
jgi:diaminohydroxyphosphoribosylaminopyrimidine deaminase/5-amino-6-(5-phosphoribosylamino)uracil reductase